MIKDDIIEFPDDLEKDKNEYSFFDDEVAPKKKRKKEKHAVHSSNSDEDYSLRKKIKAKRRRRFRAFVWVVLLLFLVAAVSLDVMLYLANEQQAITINKLKSENQALKDEFSSEKYISKEEAARELEDSKAVVKQDLKNEVLKMFENGDGILKILENVYSEKIVVPDNSGYYFYDIEESLAKNNLIFDNFQYPEIDEETGLQSELSYVEEGVTVKMGIDVSKFQGDINWEKVKNDGVEFAFIRCGYRGYETGKMVEDEKFEDNILGCNENGIDAGVYFFTEAISESEAREEADFVIDLLKEYNATIQLPIVVDLEQSSNPSKSRTTNISQEDRTNIIIAFCERVKEAGYEPMIYGNLKSHMRMTDIHKLEEYRKWFAYYRTPLRFPYSFEIWQYTSSGSVDGIKGDVDLNIAFYRE